jgi:DNA-binding GntR family transcriptional regulator
MVSSGQTDPIQPLRAQITVEESVYSELRELIVSLQLPSGTRLTQREVADRLGVSQTPVRVALGRLNREGLVATNRGRATVTPLTREQYEEVLAARLGPEALIARIGAPAVTDSDVQTMSTLLERLHSFATQRSSRPYVGTRWELHATCYRAARRPRLLSQVERLFFLCERYSVALPPHPDIFAKSLSVYGAFVEACRGRDGIRAEHAITDGIHWGLDELANHFPAEASLKLDP